MLLRMRNKLPIIAAMLRLVRTYSLSSLPTRKVGGSILLVALTLLNVLSPAVTLMTFRLHLDDHLAVCQYQRHHAEDCQARCILTEMMPEQTQALAEQAAISLCFFPVPFFQASSSWVPALGEEISVGTHFFYFTAYASPWPGIQTPPPQFL